MKKEISTAKLTKEINDTLIHRACVMRSGEYLASYLTVHNRSVDASRLIARCAAHDLSKLQNTEEFMSLASIADEMDTMHDVEHVLSAKQQEAIRLHWKSNSHHPEYYASANDMSDLDLLEMACDCHARSKQFGTNLMEYIEAQQDIRFHFDDEHYRKLRNYCLILVELTRKDDYSHELSTGVPIRFDIKDSTMRMLERFDESCYVDLIKTERLYLEKESTADFASVAYSIFLKENNTEIGYISIKFNNHIEYKIYEKYAGNGYAIEALRKFIETSTLDEVITIIRKENVVTFNDLIRLGFVVINETETSYTLRYRKPCKKLVKEVKQS